MTTNNLNGVFIDDPWAEILTPCYPEGRRLYKNDNRFWVAMNANRQLLFFVHESKSENIKVLINLSGVDIKIEPYGNDASRLICTLTDPGLDKKEKFAVVAKDVACKCERLSGNHLFIKAQETIKSWANFLKPTRSGLTIPEYVGFWGELYALSEVVMNAHPPSDAVRFWIGQEDKKQDFTLNNIAIEVKTSISGDPKKINISSADQLDKVTDKLFLLHIIANISNASIGYSLEDLYKKCLNKISNDFSSEASFLLKSSELYGRANQDQLQDKLSVVSLTLFDVREAFPCITSKNINNAIQDVKYSIQLAALKEFSVSEDLIEVVKNG